MEKHQLLTRRTLLTGVAALGAAGAGGALALGRGNGPSRPPAPVPAPGPPQRSPLKPSEYRLQPLTGYGAPRAAPRRPP
ncbi:polysaccharide deacetylase family protein, partial [Streptomyces coelicoflavus]